MKRILIFGATGLLGSDVYNYLVKKGHVVFAFNNRIDHVSSIGLIQYIEYHCFDAVINCIGMVNADQCELDQFLAWKINYKFPKILARACEYVGVDLIHVSSDYVFGSTSPSYVRNFRTINHHTNPDNYYGKTKLLAENTVRENCDKSWVVRVSMLFGHKKRTFMHIALEDGQYPSFYANQWGTPTYTVDVAAALEALLEVEPPYGILHVANAVTEPVTKLQSLKILTKHTGVKLEPFKVENMLAKRPNSTGLQCDSFYDNVYRMPSLEDAVYRFYKESLNV